MKFRLKITLCMIWLLSISFGIGGSLMIGSSFSSALSQEKAAAEDSYRFLIRTIEMVNSISTLPNTSDIAGILKEMDGMGMTNFDALRLLSGDGLAYTVGNAGLSSDAKETGISIESTADGKRYYKLCSVVGTESTPLTLVAFYDISDVFAMRSAQYKAYVLIFAATIAVGTALSYVISKWLTKPLDKLTTATRKLAGGELSYRADIKTHDEIGQLSESFDAMAQRLEENVSELQDSMRRQEEFMGSFAHEMKTPMTSIIGYADLMRTQSLSDDEHTAAVNYIFSEGKRLESLSLKLLDIIVLKNTELDMKLVSLDELICQTADYLRPEYAKSDIGIECSCETGQCLLEPELVKSLLFNLLDNARKAIGHGGLIRVSSRLTDTGCIIRVRDNGPGIPQNAMAHLTEAFYRVDKSRSRAQGGVGLGLSLCSDIAHLHGGSIEFENCPEGGACVTVNLNGGAK